MRRALPAFVVLLVATTVRAGPIDERASRALTSTVTHELMSPYCPELLLADCPTQGANELRLEVARRAAAGESAGSIEDDLVARFGSHIRAIPEFHGLGTVAWLAPPVAGVLGLLTIGFVLRDAARAPGATGNVTGVGDSSARDALDARVQDALDELD